MLFDEVEEFSCYFSVILQCGSSSCALCASVNVFRGDLGGEVMDRVQWCVRLITYDAKNADTPRSPERGDGGDFIVQLCGVL